MNATLGIQILPVSKCTRNTRANTHECFNKVWECMHTKFLEHSLLGAIPYEDLPMASLLARVVSGYRLPMPVHASEQV